ncbi:MAG: hypothetical protein LUO93_00635 [Methanomicrobiales archaeon]|nr:hypothetical protein [Methanomicrobiales archaeon]
MIPVPPPVTLLWRGTIGAAQVTLDKGGRRIDDVVFWGAYITCPDFIGDGDFGPEMIRGHGDTAQEALDDLAGSLREVAAWAQNALGVPADAVHQERAPGPPAPCQPIADAAIGRDVVAGGGRGAFGLV